MPTNTGHGSSLVHETLGTNLYALAPGFSALTLGTTLAGTDRARSPARFRKENAEQDNLSNYIPGVAAYRIGQRLADVARESGGSIRRAKQKARAEVIGTYSALLTPIALASALRHVGALKPLSVTKTLPFGRAFPGKEVTSPWLGDVQRGVTAGVGLTVAGLALAAIRKRRTKQQQAEVDKETVALDYLVPGWAGYNHYKRLGRTLDWKSDSYAAPLQSSLSPIGSVPAAVHPLSQT